MNGRVTGAGADEEGWMDDEEDTPQRVEGIVVLGRPVEEKGGCDGFRERFSDEDFADRLISFGGGSLIKIRPVLLLLAV